MTAPALIRQALLVGVLSASGSSPIFQSDPGIPCFAKVYLSPLAIGSTVQLLRSNDGGSTWQPVVTSPQALTGMGVTNSAAATDTQGFIIYDAGSLYQIQVQLKGGSAVYEAYSTWCSGSSPAASVYGNWREIPEERNVVLVEPGGTPSTTNPSMTSAQLVTLLQAATTPLAASFIAAPGTLYKRIDTIGTNDYGLIATLSVPSSASAGLELPSPWGGGIPTPYGAIRSMRVSTANVTAITDLNGNTLSSGRSWMDPQTVYTVGSSVTARDLYASDPVRQSTGSFSSSTYFAGIHGWPSLIEAAVYGGGYPNLAALGL